MLQKTTLGKRFLRSKPARIVLVAALVLLLIGGIAEIAARILVPKIAAQIIRTELQLPEKTPVTIELQGFLLGQLVGGAFKNVTVYLDEARLAPGIEASVKAQFQSFPLRPDKNPIAGGSARLAFTDKQFTKMLQTFAPDYVDTVRVRNNAIELDKDFTLFGSTVPARANVEISAENNQLVLTPQAITAGGITVAPAELSQVVGGQLAQLADRFGGKNHFCVAEKLPKGVQLQKVIARRGIIAITFKLDPDILLQLHNSKTGECA